MRRRRGLHASALAVLLSVLAAAVPTVTCAEVNVAGTDAALSIVAHQDSVQSVLSVLTQRFNVRYRTYISLERYISGTYSGSLMEVISHLLDGYNYLVRRNGAIVDITVLGRPGERPIRAKTNPIAAPAGFAAQWRADSER
jgi:hypothetical protein